MSDVPPPSAPEGSPSPHIPRWGVAVIVASVAAALIATTAAAVVITQDSTNSSQDGSPVAATPTDTPTVAADEPVEEETIDPISKNDDCATTGCAPIDELMDLIPPEVVKCSEVNPPDVAELSEVVVAVGCEAKRAAVIFVDFYLLPTPEAATAAYESLVTTIGVKRDTGDCSANKPGEYAWSGGGGEGRLLCRPKDSAGASLFWTSKGFRILGLVDSDHELIDVRGVYTVWQGISDYEG